MDCWAVLRGHTAGESPIMFGLQAGLTAAEVAEALNSLPSKSNDVPDTERASRPVWPLGMFTGFTANEMPLNGGTGPTVWTQRWTFGEDNDLYFWVFNASGAALTTGSTVRVFAKVYGVWVD